MKLLLARNYDLYAYAIIPRGGWLSHLKDSSSTSVDLAQRSSSTEVFNFSHWSFASHRANGICVDLGLSKYIELLIILTNIGRAPLLFPPSSPSSFRTSYYLLVILSY